MKKAAILGIVFGLIICVLAGAGTIWWQSSKHVSLSELVRPTPKPLPLLKYTIPNLRKYNFQTSQITIEKKIKEFPKYTSYVFSFQTLGKQMTGQINIPKTGVNAANTNRTPTNNLGSTTSSWPVIILVRGYVPPENYQTGIGTRPAAEVFAEHGYVTLAPDFFGYGNSDAESTDSWEARFQKPISVVELIKSITANPKIEVDQNNQIQVDPQKMGMWAHSNGGQIALTTLEIMDQPIPATLWAPVTAPFPYSILYFSDEEADEGKATRAYIAEFEKDYDVTQFSLTDYLTLLHSPIQIQQGTADEAIHYVWSQEFVDKIKKENADYPVVLFTYPGTNHNMQPAWNAAVQKDLDFFQKNL